MYGDPPTLKKSAKATEAVAEQTFPETHTTLELKDEETLDSMLMEYKTELRNDYHMIRGTGHCSTPLHEPNTCESTV